MQNRIKDVGIGLVVAGALFGLLELGLMAFGLGSGAENDGGYASRGFNPNAAYFAPDPEIPGNTQTKFFVRDNLGNISFPPAGKLERVVLYGGSNTQSFPVGALMSWLRFGLPEARYEVVNLGRSGYGSERVSIIFQQSLKWAEPDIVVIYSGHNEFVERGFQMDLEEQWGEPWVQSAAEVAANTRTFNTLVELLSTEQEAPVTSPEAWDWEYDKFKGISYEETLQYFAAYEHNIRRMVELALENDKRVVLCTLVGNEMSCPSESSLPPDMTAEDRQAFDELTAQVSGLVPKIFWQLIPRKHRLRINNWDYWKYMEEHGVNLTTAKFADPADLPGRRPSLGVLTDRNPKVHAPEYWDEKILPFMQALDAFWARKITPEEAARLPEVERLLDELLELCPDHPRTLFALGLVQYLLERDEADVRETLELAAEYDRAPRKVNRLTNRIVRKIAAEHPEVVLVDAERKFDERVPMGIVGWEWLLDECHINRGAAEVLMYDIAQALRARWGDELIVPGAEKYEK